MKRAGKANPWEGHCGGMHCGNIPVGTSTLVGCQCFCTTCENSRPYPAAEERTNEVVELRERVRKLEGHRNQWRRRAYCLEDMIREGRFEDARAAVAASDEEARRSYDATPSNSEDKS